MYVIIILVKCTLISRIIFNLYLQGCDVNSVIEKVDKCAQINSYDISTEEEVVTSFCGK